jgi:hypothetical protein
VSEETVNLSRELRRQVVRTLILALTVTAGVCGLIGCGGQPDPTFAGQEQAAHQRPKVGQERIDELTRIVMTREDPVKVIAACRQLREAGAEAQSALPVLEKVAAGEKIAAGDSAEIKQAAADAVKSIKAVGTAQASNSE